jgi:hypothetical protein
MQGPLGYTSALSISALTFPTYLTTCPGYLCKLIPYSSLSHSFLLHLYKRTFFLNLNGILPYKMDFCQWSHKAWWCKPFHSLLHVVVIIGTHVLLSTHLSCHTLPQCSAVLFLFPSWPSSSPLLHSFSSCLHKPVAPPGVT